MKEHFLKKLTAAILSAVMLISAVPAVLAEEISDLREQSAAESTAEGSSDETLEDESFSLMATSGDWTYTTKSGKATITGYSGSEADLEIPSSVNGIKVAAIGSDIFWECTSLTSIIIPDSVTSIGSSAFSGCTSLSSITIPGSVTSIGEYAFSGCTSLKTAGITGSGCDIEFGWTTSIPSWAFSGTALSSITLPDTVISIGKRAFASTRLQSIVIPEMVTSIGEYAFSNCSSLENVTMGSSLTSIGAHAFYSCSSLTSIIIPDNVTEIGSSAFAKCSSLTSVTIPESVTSIMSPFADCGSLTSAGFLGSGCNIEFGWTTSIPTCAFSSSALIEVTIPDSVTSVEKSAFSNCTSLETVTMGSGLTNIGYMAFSGCTALGNLTIPDSVTSIGEYAFYECTALNDLSIGSNVDNLGEGAFYGCTALTSVTIPDSVTIIGDMVFSGCTSLANITIGNGVVSIGMQAFCKTPIESIKLGSSITTIGQGVFSYCTSLTNITIPDSVTNIEEYVFEGCTSLKSAGAIGSGCNIEFGWTESIPPNAFFCCTSLTSVTIPDSVTSIGNSAFYCCTSLASIRIPDNVTNIGGYAFYQCTSLTSITIPDSVTSIGSNAFFNCTSLADVTIGTGVTSIGSSAFSRCTSLMSVTIPDSVTSIGDYAFGICSKLASVIIGNNVTTIGDYAFEICSKLTSMTIPDSVTSIGNYAFDGCSTLTSVTIGNSVTIIGYDAFYNCSKLTNVTIGNSVTTIGNSAFYKCTSLMSVTIPDSVTSIGSSAFYHCTSLTSITIPDSVTSIGASAFSACTSLVSIIIPDSVTSIGNSPFSGCDSELVIYCYAGSYADEWAAANGFNVAYLEFEEISKITVIVKDESGNTITAGYTINWYDGNSEEALASGNTLTNVTEGTEYQYKIILDDSLVLVYTEPDRAAITVGSGETEITIPLEKLPTTIVTGKIVASDGSAVEGANVTITQTVNGSREKTVSTETASDGSFALEAVRTSASLTISADGYYDAEQLLSLTGEAYDAGEIALESLPDSKITLSITMQSAAKSGSSVVTKYIASFSGLSFTLCNKTQNKYMDFTAQYPNLSYKYSEAAAGDVIEITVEDTTGTMTSDSLTLTLDEDSCGSAGVVFTENGKLNVASVNGCDSVTAMIFNSDGNFVKKYNVTTSLTTDAMPEGEYTLLLIKRTTLLNSVSSLTKLGEFPLAAGEDYLLLDFTISNGVISEIAAASVPDFDESKLYYTVEGSTSYTANKTSTVAGRLIMMTAKYEIEDGYSSSNEKIVIELPEGISFVENSFSGSGVYSLDGDTITVNTNEKSATVKFYVYAEEEGEYSLNAYLTFNLNGNDITQPIGNAALSIESLLVNAPQKTAKTLVPISGLVTPKSSVTIYLDDEPVCETTSNANGRWDYSLDLGEPYNLTFFDISITTQSTYGTSVSSEETSLMYDKTYAEVSKVTMYTGNSEVVFDFFDPSSLSYIWRSSSFTFTIEFTGDVSYVVLYVTTNGGNTYSYDAEYDAESGLWIVTAQFSSSDAPVSVAVDYISENEILLSADEIDDMYAEYEEMMQEADERYDELESLSDEVDEIAEKLTADDITDEEFTEAFAAYEAKLTEYLSVLTGVTYVGASRDLFSGMSDSEVVTYINNNIDTLKSDIDNNKKKLGDDNDDIEKNEEYPNSKLKVNSGDGTAAEKVKNGDFTPVPTDGGDDGNRAPIYVKTATEDDPVTEIADPTNDIYAAIDLSEDIGEIDTTVSDAITILHGITDSMDKINSGLDPLYDVIGSIGKTLVKLNSDLQKAQGSLEYYQSYLNRCIMLEDVDEIMAARRQVAELSTQVKTLTREINAAKRNAGCLSWLRQGGIRLLNAVTAFIACVNNLYDIAVTIAEWDDALPTECDCNSEAVKFARNEIIVLLTEMAAWYVISGLEMGVIVTSPILAPTAPIAVAVSLLATAVQVALSSKYSREVEKRKNEIRYDINAAIAACGSSSCVCKFGGICDCGGGGGSGGGSGGGGGGSGSGGSGGGTAYPGPDADVTIDPSGYVYEAVPSNRVEDVTATAYTLEEILDEFYEPTGEYEAVMWDAADYDQVNPLITDANGEYAWDVPEGQWMVEFEKDGYETTYSEWLPVPPPQTEVNVGIVSLLAPEVKAVNIYSDSVRIEFTQYMDLESVNTENVSVILNGSAVSGTIEPLNAEETYDGSTTYASIFSFVPASEMSGIASVEIKNAVNYAGRAVESAFTASASVVPAPTGIEAVESVAIGYNSSALVEITVLEGDAGKNVTLNATSSSPSIVSVVNETVVTDENGKATFALSGNLPGSGEITITIDGTDISWTIAATVGGVVTTERCGKVTANLASGSVVEKGTKIELSSSTSGAVIYYTTDGTDPTASETRTLYTEPIEINSDTVILAYAEKDGIDPSGTSGFAYKVESSGEATCSIQINMSNVVGGKLIAAAYDEEGTMLFARMFDAEAAEHMTLTLENVRVSDANKMKTVKIFHWSSDFSMQPIADVTSATIN